MKWSNPLSQPADHTSGISRYEDKRAVALKIASKVTDGAVIGAGSGSTALVALEEIARRVSEEGINCRLIPTSREIELAAVQMGLTLTSLITERPEWCFDGADEVDPGGNLIKGRGGAMYREKLVMAATEGGRYILVDSSKFVDRLGENFPVPVEVDQRALHYVEGALLNLGAAETVLRPAGGKDGPVVTESGNFIIDARFSNIQDGLEKEIKGIAGVIESGLFQGLEPQILTC